MKNKNIRPIGGYYVCPHCSAVRVNRKYKKCGACGTPLYYLGECFSSTEYGYLFVSQKKGWILINDLVKSK